MSVQNESAWQIVPELQNVRQGLKYISSGVETLAALGTAAVADGEQNGEALQWLARVLSNGVYDLNRAFEIMESRLADNGISIITMLTNGEPA